MYSDKLLLLLYHYLLKHTTLLESQGRLIRLTRCLHLKVQLL